ncbi:MAG: hypothetical protein M0Z66_11355 [Thermaerobacter sp.]|nr:hypothetical protein [Thermaerobacter sp.]
MQRFRRTLFGYSPRAVDRRLSTLEERLRISEERERLAEGLREILQVHLSQVNAEVAALRAERELLAERILSADAEAQRIRREALLDADLLRLHWRAQEEEAREELQVLKQQIATARSTYESLPTHTSLSDESSSSPHASDASTERHRRQGA